MGDPRRLATILSGEASLDLPPMREMIMRFRGRRLDSPRDTLLAEFISVADAIECAIAVQRAQAESNTTMSGEQRQTFRVGVSLGDVRVEGDRIHGDAIDIAVHVRTLADPGGVAISGTAHDQVGTNPSYRYESLGAHAVENVMGTVRVYRVIDLELARGTPAVGLVLGTHQPSIAVLPFREYDLRGTSSYFAEGIVEDIVGALASLPDLFVISRSSTLSFRGASADVRAVGATLGVQYVLSGSVRRAGERIRTLAELCDTETGGILWSDSVEGSMNDVFALQDRLSERIVKTIAPHVRQAELRRALRKRPENLDAYDFMLRGLDLLYRLRRDDFEQARTMFERAIVLEPAYATPYALTANWHSIRVGQGWSVNRQDDYEAANRLALAALERDPFDARASALCGHLRSFLFRDYEAAIDLLHRAIAASPNSADAWVWSSPTYSYVGDGTEAARRATQSLRLSPFDPHVFLNYTALALAQYTRGDFESAVAAGRKAVAANPRYTAALRIFTVSLVGVGKIDEAQAVAKALLEQEPAFRVEAFCLTHPYRDSFRRDTFARHLRSAGLPD
jgi:TolB-like protein/Flp pilus assembly protein TadD